MYLELSIARDFTPTPGVRRREQGPNSAQEFAEEHLIPMYIKAKKQGVNLYLDLDGGSGYASCFLDEAFSLLCRTLATKKVLKNMIIKSDEEPYLIEEIKEYIQHSF